MIVTLQDLPRIRQMTNQRIVLAMGTFDLFHYEHLVYLKGAKEQGDILVVAVKSNVGARLKYPNTPKNRPIIDETQRVAIVEAIQYVDYAIIADYKVRWRVHYTDKQRQWLNMFEPVIRSLMPDVLYYEDNPELQAARDKLLSTYGIEGVSKERGKSISTSAIIELAKI